MIATWYHQPQSQRGRRQLGYSVPVRVVELRPKTARIEYREPWHNRIRRRFVKRSALLVKE